MAKQKTRTIDADWVAQKQAQTTERLAEMVALAEHLKRPELIFTFLLDALATWSQDAGKQWEREADVSAKEWGRLMDSPEVQQRCAAALNALNPLSRETQQSCPPSIDDVIRYLDPDSGQLGRQE